ncbi:methylated-DNA--[protein]-cysteine S-methyltransferase [Undibacterium sp. Di24W]|uniref:methylated-DNA--[protein]-cysteine S-methyltransferase n=1 Tax=Undibacterium sp. Di24W TaxID=3413033 RepID=UPI003BF01DD9
MKKYLIFSSPVGDLRLLASPIGLVGVYFPAHKHLEWDPAWQHAPQEAVLLRAAEQLQEYFAGKRRDFDVPLDCAHGTNFQQEVWRALQTIPYGETCSYSALAQKIARPKAIRALGAANGRNPLSIIVPCHRVIAANGELQGYAGGLENKRYLLDFERLQQAKLNA